MEFLTFLKKGKEKKISEEKGRFESEDAKITGVAEGPNKIFDPETRRAYFKKMASDFFGGMDRRTLETISKFTNEDDPSRAVVRLPETSFQNHLLRLLVSGKVGDLNRFVTEYTHAQTEVLKEKKVEIGENDAKKLYGANERMALGVEKVFETVMDAEAFFKKDIDTVGFERFIGTNDTLDAKHKIDLVVIVRDPQSGAIVETSFVQVKRGVIDEGERRASVSAHFAYASELERLAEEKAYKGELGTYDEGIEEFKKEKRRTLLDRVSEKYGFFGLHFVEQPISELEERGVDDAEILRMMSDVDATFSIHELALFVKNRDARELFNIESSPEIDRYLSVLEKWAKGHTIIEEVRSKISPANIARSQNFSSIIVDAKADWETAYSGRIPLKDRVVLTMAA